MLSNCSLIISYKVGCGAKEQSEGLQKVSDTKYRHQCFKGGLRMDKMKLKIIDQDFSICKVADLSQVDYSDEFYFIGKTDEELSLVCNTDLVPKNAIECDNGWRAFRIKGVLDFSLVGILSRISTLLAENNIGIFAVSTYNTDYILVKKENFDEAINVLERNGYVIK
jgi:hypothetical protein